MNLLRKTAVILIFALILSASYFLISSPATSSTSNNLPSVTQTNVAYLNGTETYYTNAGQTSAGSITYYSQPNYYLNSTAIFAGSVGTTQQIIFTSALTNMWDIQG